MFLHALSYKIDKLFELYTVVPLLQGNFHKVLIVEGLTRRRLL